MIVSWDWLSQYVDLNMTHDELVDRLTMSGLNHEETIVAGGDQAIDLEVTSNRADCLGHIGVAREVATLFDLPLNIPTPSLQCSSQKISDVCRVTIQCPDICYRYTARMLKNVKIGPSPDWLVKRLEAIGQQSVNNVVDVTNYVMFECGQPLHAFDFGKVENSEIVVRQPKSNEKIVAIDHKSYDLKPGMCVIADAENPLAIGGVMGGADSEISGETTDILIEAAYFDQISVRNTARSLNLHSPSSFRFERNIDSAGIEWASRRCCELILQVGGGELLEGVIDVGSLPEPTESVTLRMSQLKRVLGIEIPIDFAEKTLRNLGLEVNNVDSAALTATAPSWRKDLTREVDLIEEVGRVYGFDKVPDNAPVPMAASYKTKSDRVVDKVRAVLTSAGYDEAMTASLVPEKWSTAFTPWSDLPALISSQPMQGVLEKASQNLGAVEFIRRSLVPSLLEARRINEYRANTDIQLFETAKVYLADGDSKIPNQPVLVTFTTGQDFYTAKGVVETLVDTIAHGTPLELKPFDHPLFDMDQVAEISVAGERLGFLGMVSEQGKKDFGLRHDACVAEIDMDVLEKIAVSIPIYKPHSMFPAITRDFNFVMAESVRWSQIEATVAKAAGELLESVEYIETFRNHEKDGVDKKRVLLSVTLRSLSETLTGERAEAVSQLIVESCKREQDAVLLG